MNEYYPDRLPEKTANKMVKHLEEKINRCNLFNFKLSRLEIIGPGPTHWFGNVTAQGIINKHGITDIRIKSVDSLTATTDVFYDNEYIAKFTMIYFNDDNIVIPNFEYILSSMNLSICKQCGYHKNECSCNDVDHGTSEQVKEILRIMDVEHPEKTRFFDPDELLHEERRIEIVETKEEKPKIDIVKFEPIITGICTTLRYNKKKVEEMAIKILTSNPDIPDNQLATEIIRQIRG